MQKYFYRVAVVVGLFLLISCGKQIPRGIIQPEQMEEVLYDYHLSVSMSNNLDYSENYKKTSYNNYVFQKHGLTQAEFDSSMVWYTRHVEELAAIYSRLNIRFKDEKQRIGTALEARQTSDFVSLPGDTVESWPYRNLYWLCSTPLNNLITFTIESDSNFHPKDAFLWKANYTFLAKGKATMALNILFDNDSVIGQSKLITSSGIDSLYLHTDSTYKIKNINAFIYLMSDSSNISSLLVNDLSLTKYHAPKDTVQAVSDTIPAEDVVLKTTIQKSKVSIEKDKLEQIEKRDVSLKLVTTLK